MKIEGFYGNRSVTGVRKTKRPTASSAPSAAAAARTGGRDRVEIGFRDVLSAEKRGYIEVNGEAVSVSPEMAERMRRGYAAAAAINEAALLRETVRRDREASERQAEAYAKEQKKLMQAIEIAARIAKGGRVPPKDERFLMEFSQEMYLTAKLQAMSAKEHKKYDSVLEDEEERAQDGTAEEASTAGVSAEIAPAPESAGAEE